MRSLVIFLVLLLASSFAYAETVTDNFETDSEDWVNSGFGALNCTRSTTVAKVGSWSLRAQATDITNEASCADTSPFDLNNISYKLNGQESYTLNYYYNDLIYPRITFCEQGEDHGLGICTDGLDFRFWNGNLYYNGSSVATGINLAASQWHNITLEVLSTKTEVFIDGDAIYNVSGQPTFDTIQVVAETESGQGTHNLYVDYFLIGGLSVNNNFSITTNKAGFTANINGSLWETSAEELQTNISNSDNLVNITVSPYDFKYNYTINNYSLLGDLTYSFNEVSFAATNYTNGAGLSDFNVTINQSDYFQQFNGSGTTLQVFHPNGTYTVTIRKDGYSPDTFVTDFSGDTTINRTLLRARDVIFYFFDAATENLITSLVNTELIGDTTYNFTTTTGTKLLEGVAYGDYIAQYTSENYANSFYDFTLAQDTAQNISLYLHNDSQTTAVTGVVVDELSNELQDVKITVLRNSVISGGYYTDQIASTNFEGEAILNLVLNTKYYKFILEYPEDTVVLETSPTLITGTTLGFQIDTSEEALQNYQNIKSVFYNLTYNNVTNNFRYNWIDTNNVVEQACLKLYRVRIAGETLINESCKNTVSGTILLNATIINGTSYRADAYLDVGNGLTFVTSNLQNKVPELADEGAMLFYISLLSATLALAGAYISIGLGIAILPAGFLIASFIGLLPTGLFPILVGIQITMVIVGFLVGGKQ